MNIWSVYPINTNEKTKYNKSTKYNRNNNQREIMINVHTIMEQNKP